MMGTLGFSRFSGFRLWFGFHLYVYLIEKSESLSLPKNFEVQNPGVILLISMRKQFCLLDNVDIQTGLAC